MRIVFLLLCLISYPTTAKTFITFGGKSTEHYGLGVEHYKTFKAHAVGFNAWTTNNQNREFEYHAGVAYQYKFNRFIAAKTLLNRVTKTSNNKSTKFFSVYPFITIRLTNKLYIDLQPKFDSAFIRATYRISY